MYNNRNRGTSRFGGQRFSSGQSGNRPSQGRRFGGGRNVPKKLPAHFFINKPVAQENSQQVYENSYSSFSEFNLESILTRNIQTKGYTAPTPIQDQAIPAVLAGRDVIGLANTGTGKTAAFLIPLINAVVTNPSHKILIVTPTRELAMQIKDELFALSRGLGTYSVLAIGGASVNKQKFDLRRGFNFLIGTPGRLKDLIMQRALHLGDFTHVVLDEVDRMLDIGFIRDVEYMIGLLPQERQSLFFSATITPKVQQVVQKFVNDPVTVSVKTQETAHTIEQDVIKVQDRNQKIEQLHELLIQAEFSKVIIFGRTKHGVERLSRELDQRGFRNASIHGNKTQGQRQRALQAFKRDQVQILLATDVASRGIDVQDVTHVINYDAPESYDDYVHRIGRTGRANKKGKAITFVE